ncbi:unnamed protein product [Toxocara canis]|uniref:G protein-coupled receptor n=1 Tax=Toxocara canis TaxID=6265 RepID=A0A183V6T9_TOXCA|nr:unnamed protein product [Toxocara canis]
MLFGVDAAIVYLRVESLFVLYHLYIVPAYVLSRITQLAIPYMLIFGTLERFVWISGRKNAILKNMYSVNEFPNCTDFFRSKSTGPADWVLDNAAYYFFDFHLLSIAQTFIPFLVLLVFNLVIVRKLAKEREETEEERVNDESNAHHIRAPICLLQRDFIQLVTSGGRTRTLLRTVSHEWLQFGLLFSLIVIFAAPSVGFLTPFRRTTSLVRNAIYATVAIVTTYLISNGLHLILTILERSKSSLLRDPTDANLASTFHTVFSDTVSFVYMFTSAIRLIVYCICDPTTRKDVRQVINVCEQQNKKVTSVFVSVQNYSCAIFI